MQGKATVTNHCVLLGMVCVWQKDGGGGGESSPGGNGTVTSSSSAGVCSVQRHHWPCSPVCGWSQCSVEGKGRRRVKVQQKEDACPKMRWCSMEAVQSVAGAVCAGRGGGSPSHLPLHHATRPTPTPLSSMPVPPTPCPPPGRQVAGSGSVNAKPGAGGRGQA